MYKCLQNKYTILYIGWCYIGKAFTSFTDLILVWKFQFWIWLNRSVFFFFLIPEEGFTEWLNYHLFICFLADGHLGCFQSLAAMNKAAIFLVQVFCENVFSLLSCATGKYFNVSETARSFCRAIVTSSTHTTKSWECPSLHVLLTFGTVTPQEQPLWGMCSGISLGLFQLHFLPQWKRQCGER